MYIFGTPCLNERTDNNNTDEKFLFIAIIQVADIGEKIIANY